MNRPMLSRGQKALLVFTGLVLGYATLIAVRYSHQPPLDWHSFRQTQTALTAYWFTQEGFKLAYETPVGGAPWSIPFEFPLYQAIVAVISKVFGVSLDATGRLVSFAFLLLCLWPVRAITKKLEFDRLAFPVFAILVFSSPIYLYWGRAFMIETAALFFALAAIKYFVDGFLDGFGNRNVWLMAAFLSLSLLQKAPTGVSVALVLAGAYFVREASVWRRSRRLEFRKHAFVALACFVLPLAVCAMWVYYTDQVKLQNPFGQQLTSAALRSWNWGTLAQRFSNDFYIGVFWRRLATGNLGGLLGVFLLTLPWVCRASAKVKIVASVSVLLGIVPLYLFTNLHLEHDYYQAANAIFLMYALALSLSQIVLPQAGMAVASTAVLLIAAANYSSLRADYLHHMRHKFTVEDRDFAVGKILRRELPPQGQFVAFGNGWSSTFAYIAQRKSFTIEGMFTDFESVKTHPENFVEPGRLGAVVTCAGSSVGAKDFFKWRERTSWKIGESNDCLIATPQASFAGKDAQHVECVGGLERAEVESRDGVQLISVVGWNALSTTKPEFPDKVFIVFAKKDEAPQFLEALRVPRPDVAGNMGAPNADGAGFSLLTPTNLIAGDYAVGVARSIGGRNEICQFKKMLTLN